MRFPDLKLSLGMVLDIPALRYNFSFIGDSDTLFYHQESHRGEPIIERERERERERKKERERETGSWLSNQWCEAFELFIREKYY
jgi:hypothetical protein